MTASVRLDALQAAISNTQATIRESVMALTPALQSPDHEVTYQQQRYVIEGMFGLLNDYTADALDEAKRALREEAMS